MILQELTICETVGMKEELKRACFVQWSSYFFFFQGSTHKCMNQSSRYRYEVNECIECEGFC